MRPLYIAALTASALAAGALAPVARCEDPPAAKPDASPQQQYDALKAEYDKAVADFRAAMEGAKTNDEKRAIATEKQPKTADWLPRFQAIADKYPKDPAAAQSLAWIVQRTNGEAQAKLLDLMLATHPTSPALGDASLPLERSTAANAESFLRTVMAKNPDSGAKGKATFGLAKLLARRADLAARLKQGDANFRKQVEAAFGVEQTNALAAADPEAMTKESESLIESVDAKYADVKVGDTTLGAFVKPQLFERRNLAIGKVAPDIVGADVDGKPMKLSDFRGKVVVLDFFGFW